MDFAAAAEVLDLAAGDLDEVADAAGGHRFANKVEVRVLVALALADRGCDGGGIESVGSGVRVVRQCDDVRGAVRKIVRRFAAAIVGVVAFDAKFDQAGNHGGEGDGAGEALAGEFIESVGELLVHVVVD